MKVKSESEVAQSCPSLRDPMDCSPPGSSVHGIFQARVLEWGAIAFSIWSLEVVAFTKYSTFAVFISPNDFSVPLFWDFNYIYVKYISEVSGKLFIILNIVVICLFFSYY